MRTHQLVLNLGLGLAALFSLPLRAEEAPAGWLWYQDPLFTPPEDASLAESSGNPVPDTVAKTSSPKPDIEALTPAEIRSRSLGRRFEAQVALALESPTFDNVRQAQALQREIFARAERFQKMWQQVALMDPETYAPDANPNTSYRALYKKRQAAERTAQIQSLVPSWGLFFLVKKGCPYCEHFAPHVKRLEARFGFEVTVVSPDGGTLDLFPPPRSDNGALATLNPQGIYPALLLAHPASGTVVPLSWGMTSYDQLLENFDLVLQTLETR